METFHKKLYLFLKEERTKANIPKDVAWEFNLSKEEKELIIGPIEDSGGSEQNYIYAIYPWEDEVYALTEDGWDIPLQLTLSPSTVQKLYTSILNRI